MTTLEFKIEINASKEKVWDVLWNDETYRKWATVFCEGSYAVSDWNEGHTIHFLSPNGDGMSSVIFKKKGNEYMAFKHLNELKDFKEVPIDAATQEWIGAMEAYSLKENGTGIILEVKVDVVEKYIDYFKTTFPKGLDIVKKLSENE